MYKTLPRDAKAFWWIFSSKNAFFSSKEVLKSGKNSTGSNDTFAPVVPRVGLPSIVPVALVESAPILLHGAP